MSNGETKTSELTSCALCERRIPLVVSHVLPKFVFRWLKETSATGFLRQGDAPHKRVQDGLKYPWLCQDCEVMLNGFETPFATNIFHPYNANSGLAYRYEEWLAKFCVSVSWRVLRHAHENGGLQDWPKELRDEARAAAKHWKAFLFDEVRHPGRFEQHLLPLSEIASSTIRDLPNGINRYFTRAIELSLCNDGVSAMTFAKMGRFALFGIITPARDKWERTRVSPKGGVIRSTAFAIPGGIDQYLLERAANYGRLASSIPDDQQQRIEAAILRDPQRFRSSETFTAMMRDAEMFGPQAVVRDVRKA